MASPDVVLVGGSVTSGWGFVLEERPTRKNKCEAPSDFAIMNIDTIYEYRYRYIHVSQPVIALFL